MAISTDNQAKALKPKEQIYDTSVNGARGLILRVYPSGTKTWIYRARNRDSGKLERMTLGEYRSGPKLGEEDARLSLAEAIDKAAINRSIKREHGSAKRYREEQEAAKAAERRSQAAQEARDSYTLATMVEDYLKVIADEKRVNGPRGQRFIRSWPEVQRSLYKYVLDRSEAGEARSDVAHKPAPDVTDDDLKDILEGLKPVQANRVRAYVSGLFSWGMKNKKVAHNPALLVDPNKETARQRVLEKAEIKRFLTNLPKTDLPDVHQDFLKFLLLTGCRYEEASSAPFRWVDEDEKLLHIPRTKNEEPHTVPLSPQAMEIIERRKGKSEWIFPSADPKKHLTKYEVHPRLRDAIGTLGVMPFTPHDLRRTFRTGLARLGCPDSVAELAIGHKKRGVLAIYNRYRYEDELREWFDKWGAEVAAVNPPALSVAAA